MTGILKCPSCLVKHNTKELDLFDKHWSDDKAEIDCPFCGFVFKIKREVITKFEEDKTCWNVECVYNSLNYHMKQNHLNKVDFNNLYFIPECNLSIPFCENWQQHK